MSNFVDKPVAGFYKRRLVKGGPWVPVCIWFGGPIDPVTGEEMDRSPRWQALQMGQEVDVWVVWPWCAGHPISEDEYSGMIEAPPPEPRKAQSLSAMKPVF